MDAQPKFFVLIEQLHKHHSFDRLKWVNAVHFIFDLDLNNLIKLKIKRSIFSGKIFRYLSFLQIIYSSLSYKEIQFSKSTIFIENCQSTFSLNINAQLIDILLNTVHKNNTFFLILLSIFGRKLLTAIIIFPVYCHIKNFIAGEPS